MTTFELMLNKSVHTSYFTNHSQILIYHSNISLKKIEKNAV